MMKPTELVYSSHDRCEHIHRDWIVQRALERWDNKTILYLPMSSGEIGDQEYSWGTFSWYLDRFRPYGLEPRTFLWRDDMARRDLELLFGWLRNSEVVILGGGATQTGLDRYRALGERAFGDPDAFVETLQARRASGQLTVGFSAGAAQLCEHSCDNGGPTFGLIEKVVVTLHHEPASRPWLRELANRHPESLVFGLPNDAGIAVTTGHTRHGHRWQQIQFILDTTWDRPEDGWHIKSRQGIKIEHPYADGRGWDFNGGDVLVRVFQPDGTWQAWIKRPEVARFHDYGLQAEGVYRSLEEILDER